MPLYAMAICIYKYIYVCVCIYIHIFLQTYISKSIQQYLVLFSSCLIVYNVVHNLFNHFPRAGSSFSSILK